MQASASEGEQAMMRRILGWIVAWTALAFSGSVLGESYPSRPVTLIVPYAAGGGVDAVARVITESLSERLGQRFVIENVTGAGGVIGTQRAARAQPDGYTLLFAVENTMAVAKLVQPTVVQYDSQKDSQPISLIGTAPLVLAGKKDLPANNIAELMTLLKANPGKYSFASSGVGTSLHVLGEMINVEGKVKMVHVPYRAAPQIVTDLISN
jgi:tripartite-type tricarboxylate transporter receptor subunit TctC